MPNHSSSFDCEIPVLDIGWDKYRVGPIMSYSRSRSVWRAFDARLPLGLPDQGWTHPAADAAALFAQETGLFSHPDDSLEPRLDDATSFNIPRN